MGKYEWTQEELNRRAAAQEETYAKIKRRQAEEEKRMENYRRKEKIKEYALAGIPTGLVVLFLVFFFHTNPHTPAGHEGYVFEKPRLWGKGGFQGIVEGPGNYGISVWRNRVMNLDVRPQTFIEEFQVLSKDDLKIRFRAHALLSPEVKRTREVVESYGGLKWYERFVKEPLRTFVRETAQGHNATDLKSKVDAIGTVISEKLGSHIGEAPFKIHKIVVGNIQYPEIVETAVQRKLEAQQNLQKKETEKLIAAKEAEIRIEEAKGIAEAQKIINTTLTANYLQHEAIQAQGKMANSPNHTTVYIPVGANGIPIVHER